MWVQIILAGLILAGSLPVLAVVYSFVRTAAGRRYDTAFYNQDRCDDPEAVIKRRYRGPGHFLYRFFDTLRYSYPQLRVYMFQALSPAFREKIMITTALANSCAQ